MRVVACLDESSSHGTSPFVILGVLVATPFHWREFDRDWRALLARFGLDYFHATDLATLKKAHKGWSPARRTALVEAANAIIQKRCLCALTVRLDRADYAAHYRPNERVKGVQLDSLYGLCFRHAVTALPDMIKRSFRRDDLVIDIVMEAGDKSMGSGDCARVLAQLKQHIPEVGAHLGELSEAGKAECFGVQGADAIAYSATREERGAPDLMDFPDDGTLADARAQVAAGCPIFRLQVSVEAMVQLRENLVAWTDERRAQGRAIQAARVRSA